MGYGLPLRCSSCVTRWLIPGLVRGTWFVVSEISVAWQLKVPGEKAKPCPNCGARLIAVRRKR